MAVPDRRALTAAGEFRVAGCRVQVAMLRVGDGEETVKLEPKVMQVLVYLASHAGEAVTRQALADAVWPGVIVGDDALTNTINKLRKAFGDDPRDPGVIETIPKVGYRLIADVEQAARAENPGAVNRKLTAILYADVAGYSRLMSEDEDRTHREVSRQLNLLSESIVAHGGTVMHYAGDAVLADFQLVVEAVDCAVSVQRQCARTNADTDSADRVQFRIGIHVGDVIMDRGEIYGDGVNVAARLESLAEPGGICISRGVYDAVGSRLALGYESIGEQQVKNIAKPVQAYRVVLEAPTAAHPTRPRRARTWALLLAAVLVLGAAGLYLSLTEPTSPPGSESESTVAAPSAAPSIAVLPFDNLNGDPTQAYFSDGITDDLITDLSKARGLTVISRNSSFRYRGGELDMRQVARALGAGYLVTGSVRKAGERIRINARLTHGGDGSQVWAERYDGDLRDVFDLQDRITERIVGALVGRLTTAPAASASAGTASLEAYDAFLKGMERFRGYTPDDAEQAVVHFKRAIELDADYSRAYAALAATYWEAWKRDWHRGTGWPWASGEQAIRYLDQANEVPTPLSLQLNAEMLLQGRRFDEAEAEARRAVALDPNDPAGHVTLALVLAFAGRPAEAIPVVREGMRLDPHYSGYYLTVLGWAQFIAADHQAAAETFAQAARRSPTDPSPLVLLAAVPGALDRSDEARATLARVDALYQRNGLPRFTIDKVLNRWQFRRPADREAVLGGLRAAGARQW